MSTVGLIKKVSVSSLIDDKNESAPEQLDSYCKKLKRNTVHVAYFLNIVRYIILLQPNPTVKRRIQLVCEKAIYKADFCKKSNNNMLMHMFWCPRPFKMMLLPCVLIKLHSLYEVSGSL